jgi:hypothetical protein
VEVRAIISPGRHTTGRSAVRHSDRSNFNSESAPFTPHRVFHSSDRTMYSKLHVLSVFVDFYCYFDTQFFPLGDFKFNSVKVYDKISTDCRAKDPIGFSSEFHPCRLLLRLVS